MPELAVVAHWYQLIDSLQYSSRDFYDRLDESIERRQIPGAEVAGVELPEGGLFSGKRMYLTVERKDHTFAVCAAPFGSGFFVSSWLLQKRSFVQALAEVPLIGFFVRWLVRPITYYTFDTALMFQSAVHAAVLEVIDAATSEKGIRALSELERKPILREFYNR